MAFTSSFDKIEFGNTRTLYARLDTQSTSAWRVLGTITRTSAGTHLALRPEAESFRSLWHACAFEAKDVEICRVIFGAASGTGAVETIASAGITLSELRAARSPASGQPKNSRRTRHAAGVAPRALRTNFPAWMMCGEDAKESARIARAEAREARRAARAARLAALLNQAA